MRMALAILLALSAPAAHAEATVTVMSGSVRVLDKITGSAQDIRLTAGQSAQIGYLAVSMGECRYPSGNPAGDAFMQLVIHDSRSDEPVFAGWMVASNPALNPLDHQRYDVWPLRCEIDEAAPPQLDLQPVDEPEPAPAE